MELKRSSLALLVCSLFVSGAAFANGGGHHPSGGLDVDIDVSDSFNNKTTNNNHNESYSKSYSKSFDYDVDWSNDQEWNYTKHMTMTDKMIANSKVKGKLEDVSVSYSSGGSGMGKPYGKRGGHGGHSGDSCCGGVTVSNTNSLDGFQNAAGITAVAQNVGGNALAQQSVAINTK